MKKRVLTCIGEFFARLASYIVSTATAGVIGEVQPPESLLHKNEN